MGSRVQGLGLHSYRVKGAGFGVGIRKVGPQNLGVRISIYLGFRIYGRFVVFRVRGVGLTRRAWYSGTGFRV